MGWKGHRDGYYKLDDLSGYNEEQWLLTEIADSNYHAASKEVRLTKAGTLASMLSKQEQQTTRHLRVSGPVAPKDFAMMRDMVRNGLLRTIDMEDAKIDVLPDSAFFECTYLSHFITPRTLQRTGIRTFWRCRNLNNVVFHEGFHVVGNAAFSGCTNLLSVHLPSTTTMIGHNAFTSCESLLNVWLPEGLWRIGNYAFSYCNNLYSIYLPKRLKNIGKETFHECPRLHRITIDPQNRWYEADSLHIKAKQ